MRKAAVSIRPDAVIGDTDPRLFGAFVEHVGRCVYGGSASPGTPAPTATAGPPAHKPCWP